MTDRIKRICYIIIFAFAIIGLAPQFYLNTGKNASILIPFAVKNDIPPVSKSVQTYLKYVVNVRDTEADLLDLTILNCPIWNTECENTIKILLEREVRKDNRFFSPLHTAIITNNLEATKFLVAEGFDPLVKALDGKYKGLTPAEVGARLEVIPQACIDYLNSQIKSL